MKKYCSFLLLLPFIFQIHVNAQNKDSLFKVATKLPVGTRVVKATLDLALLYLATEPDSAISWSSKAIALAKTVPKAEKWLTNGWNSQG